MLQPGDPVPPFTAVSSVNPNFHFDTIAGRYVVVTFFASTVHPVGGALLDEIKKRGAMFDAVNRLFIGVSSDPDDRERLKTESPGMIYFLDADGAAGGAFNFAATDQQAIVSFVLSPALRVFAVISSPTPAEHARELFDVLNALPDLAQDQFPAPVLIVPAVFERDFCKTLIEYYNTHEQKESGYVRDVGGKTVAVYNNAFKRRFDCEIVDEALIKQAQLRLSRRLIPAIRAAFQFHANRIERNIIACYDAKDGGHFNAHRDNTSLATAHRRFAVTINLNTEDFEGGELWFPEFSRRKYRATTGGAVVFSCSLMHEASPVTGGKRFAFLPFLYDDAAARIRAQNQHALANASPAPQNAPANSTS